MAFPLVGVVVGLLVSIAVGAVLQALAPTKQKKPGDVEIPTASEGDAIPVVFGTVKIAPNVVWWGDVLAEPMKGPRKVLGLVGPRETLGHKYHVGMQGALCWGQIDALVEVIIDDKYRLSAMSTTSVRAVSVLTGQYTTTTTPVISPSLPAVVAAAGRAFSIIANNLFGGKEKEGGVAGVLSFYYGSLSQETNSYLQSAAQSPWPAYKGLTYAVWEQMYLGTVPYLKHWHFVVRRCPTALGVIAGNTALSRIGDDANPAEVLWEMYTDARWGLARSSAALDQASFLSALSVLKTEGCGLSGTFEASSADQQAQEILRHIDGVLVQDPTTGLIRLKLIRADYVRADLRVFNQSNISELQHTRPQMADLATEVKVNFTDRAANYTTRTRAAYNQALRQALGRAQTTAVSYPWFTTPANAERAALRDLHAQSSEFAAGTMVANRSAAYLALGDPFVIHVPDEGLTSVVARVTRIDYGTIHEKEPITVQWAEDVFGSQGGVYVAEPATRWSPPPATNAGQRFDVETEFVLSADQGCLTLRITGDVSAITAVETQTQKGDEAASGWAAADNSAPITVCVDRHDVIPGRIAYRITHTQADGTTDTIEEEVSVPPKGVYLAPRIDLVIDSSGNVAATVTPDGGVAALARASGDTTDYPADATVDGSVADAAAPFSFALGPLATGATMYVKAVTVDANGRKSAYGTASISRSAAGAGGVLTSKPPYPITADTPGQWTRIRNLASTVTEVGVESHFLFDFRNYDRVALSGVVVVGGPAKYAIQYQRSDLSWHFVDGVGGPFLALDTVGDIIGASVAPEAEALTGKMWCRRVTYDGDDTSFAEIGHIALQGGPHLAGPTDVFDWNHKIDGHGDDEIPDQNGSGVDMVLHYSGISPEWFADGVEFRHLGTFNFEYGQAVSDLLTMERSSVFLYYHMLIQPPRNGSGVHICGRSPRADINDDRHMTIGFDGKVRVIVKANLGPVVTVTSTSVFDLGDMFVAGWTHDGVTLRLWINGVEEDSAAVGLAAPLTPASFAIGAGEPPTSFREGPSQGGFGASHGSRVGRVVLANRAFTQTEVEALYNEFATAYGLTPLP